MKALYVLGFFLLSLNTQLFAYQRREARLDSADKKELIAELQKGLQEFKAASGGKIDFKRLKPLLADRLSDFHSARTVTMEELKNFEHEYDAIAAKYSSASTEDKEKAINQLFEHGFKSIESTPLKKLKLGEICNKWDCEKGLDCATVPPRLEKKFRFAKRCITAKRVCTSNSQCCSGVCEFKSQKSKYRRGKAKIIGRCQPTMRCFKPARLNTSCQNTATCQNGDCQSLDWGYAGTNECQNPGLKCSRNIDCCSNKCEKNVCVENFMCTNCVKQGQKVKRGRKCCEGLYPDLNGKCIKAVPPLVIPGFSYIKIFINFIFPTASADEVTNQASDFIKNKVKNDRGESFDQVFQNGYGADEFKMQKEINAKVKAAVNQATGGGQKYQSKCQGAAAQRRYHSVGKNGKKRYNEKGEPIMVTCEQHERELQQRGLNQYMRTPKFPIGEKSNFKTCQINFKNDYLHFLDKQNLLNLEFALAGFEYVMLGSGVDDFWKQDSRGPTIYKQLKKVASEHRKHRNEIFKTITDKEKHLRCLCLDRMGYPKIPKASDKEWFKDNCSEQYKEYETQLANIKSQYKDFDPKTMWEGDATGVKYKEMLIEWTGALAEYQAALADINSQTFEASYDFAKLTNEYNWNQTDTKPAEELFKFTVYPFEGNIPTTYKLGFSLGAMLAAGAVAVVAGVAGPAFLTAWTAAGIIAGGAATGATAQWALGALRGAWSAQPPIVEDVVTRASYKCTKKGARCQDYKRVIHQPVNNVCGKDMPFNANACIRHFIAVPRELTAADQKYLKNFKGKEKKFQEKQLAYDILIDPWIPWEPEGQSKLKSMIIKDTTEHVAYLKAKVEGSNGAIGRMKQDGPEQFNFREISKAMYNLCVKQKENNNSNNNSYGYGGWYNMCDGDPVPQNGKYYLKTPKPHIGKYINVSIGYLSAPFLDATKVGYYVPDFIKNSADQYILSKDAIKVIKENAMKYIVEEAALLTDKDVEAKKKFADYVFKYHFIWPRTSRPGTIMYPPQSFLTYLDLLAHGFGTISYSNTEAYSAYRQRQQEYIDNLLNTMPPLAQSSLMTDQMKEQSIKARDHLVNDLKKKSNYFKSFKVGLHKGMNGGIIPMSGSKLNGQTLSTADQQAFHAINRLNKIRKEQLKAADHFNKVAGDSAFAKKMATSRDSAMNNFYTPAAGDKGFHSFSTFADRIGLGGDNSDSKNSNHGLSNSSAALDTEHKNKFNIPAYKGYKSNYGSGSDDSSISTLADPNSSNTVKGRDAEKIEDALKAIEEDKSAIESSTSGEGLFDIVTKAYFRSYKRIFSPKKLEAEPTDE